jgi:hypothetical protein
LHPNPLISKPPFKGVDVEIVDVPAIVPLIQLLIAVFGLGYTLGRTARDDR